MRTTRNQCELAMLALLMAALVLSAACSKREAAEIPGLISENLKLEEAFTLMEDHRHSQDFIIIDLRPAAEYADGHIEEAVNLDYSSDDFIQELDGLDRAKIYLLYCRNGDVSRQVMDMMAGLGFAEVYNMLGGIQRWRQTGLPLVR